MSAEDLAKQKMKKMLNDAIDSGAPAAVLKLQIDGMEEENRRQNLEQQVRQSMDLGPETKSEPTPPSFVEELVRDQMLHGPASTPEPFSSNPDVREQQVRRQMHLPETKEV